MTNSNSNSQSEAHEVADIAAAQTWRKGAGIGEDLTVWTGFIDGFRVVIRDHGRQIMAHAYRRGEGLSIGARMWPCATIDHTGKSRGFYEAEPAALEALLTLMTEVQASQPAPAPMPEWLRDHRNTPEWMHDRN